MPRRAFGARFMSRKGRLAGVFLWTCAAYREVRSIERRGRGRPGHRGPSAGKVTLFPNAIIRRRTHRRRPLGARQVSAVCVVCVCVCCVCRVCVCSVCVCCVRVSSVIRMMVGSKVTSYKSETSLSRRIDRHRRPGRLLQAASALVSSDGAPQAQPAHREHTHSTHRTHRAHRTQTGDTRQANRKSATCVRSGPEEDGRRARKPLAKKIG